MAAADAEQQDRNETEDPESHKHEIEIVVDGQQKSVPTHDVTWNEVVDLAFPGERQNPDLTFVVTYSDAAHDKSGILAQDATVRVKEKDTSFNVAKHRRS